MTIQDYEKLGQFYLGREYDLATRESREGLILYDSRDLVTHAVCVGMTGSGKTGLCIGLLEEAAIDGIPAIVIDPKGDLANLMLTFPELKPEEFRPWINPDEARRKGIDEDTYASEQADLWRRGLEKWHQPPQRIQRLRDSAEFAIYTPGSSAGIPLSIVKSFSVPPRAILDDAELLRERVATTATSLLGLLGIDADPIQSREHILLSNLLSRAWGAGQDMDLASLIQQIQTPPMDRIGVLDLESFYPQKDRFGLAMLLNNLLAAPGFQSWMEGEPLDIQSLLHGKSGKPRIAIISIAHLGDAERMFFVSLLLNQVLGWMRMQRGTTSLRAILYMDEIFGYFPPVANPPSKQPLLTMLKQARAFGLGVVLATQNPVDLDYKGLANCGTWFIGRLQTERDKLRVLEGLEGAAAGAAQKFDRARMEQTLAGLGNRVFLMNNVHEERPVTFETRWCLSYLRGPLGREEIKRLMAPLRSAAPEDAAPPRAVDAARRPERAREPEIARASASARPVLPPEVKQYFVPVRGPAPADATLLYEPYLLGTADVFFFNRKVEVDVTRTVGMLALIKEGPVPVEWSEAAECVIPESELDDAPLDRATFDELPGPASNPKQYDRWAKSLVDHLYRTEKLDLWTCDACALAGTPDESERDYRARLAQALREQRDEATDKLRARYAPKFDALQERIRRAEQRREKEKAEAQASTWTSVISVGASLMGAFLGRKRVSVTNARRVASASRTIGRSMQQSADVGRADENLEALQQNLADLEQEFNKAMEQATDRLDANTIPLSQLTVRPRKTDIKPRLVALAWVPHWRDASARLRPAWE